MAGEGTPAVMREGGTSVRIDALTAGYGGVEVLRAVSLVIDPGELVTLLGPSGCGKSTLLRAIAGLHPLEAGGISFNERPVDRLPPEKRRIAMVFQRPLLFPWLNVAENVRFGLRMRRVPDFVARQRVDEALRLVRLDSLADRRPAELSGGQEQRVALARAIVTEPDLLLLDEPFTALDENLRREMRQLVRRLQQQLSITTIFVTHDQVEAAMVADRIALLLDGRLAQIDPPRHFYTRPADPEVARFFGWQMITAGGGLLALRPELVRLRGATELAASPLGEPIFARVATRQDLGLKICFSLELDDGTSIEVSGESFEGRRGTALNSLPEPGERVSLDFPSESAVYFPLR
ncbi:MAG: hypothetical protein RIR52_798 [Acidobacteriota bacterium]